VKEQGWRRLPEVDRIHNAPGENASVSDTPEPAVTSQIHELQRCRDDIGQLYRLPAGWRGLGAEAITRKMRDTLAAMMKLDFVDLRLAGAPGAFPRLETALLEDHGEAAILEAVECWLKANGDDHPGTLLLGKDQLSVLSLPLGQISSLGRLVALSRRANFPTPDELLTLQIATSITSLALREAQEVTDRKAHPDLPQQKTAVRTLAESERNLTLILNTIPAMAWCAAPDGMLEGCNQRLLDFVGLPLEAILGSGFSRIFHPDDMQKLLTTWQDILTTQRGQEVEGRIRSADGSYRWFMFRQNPLLDAGGNVLKWYGVIVDIEDRKRAQDELHAAQAALMASEKNLRQTIDALPVLVWSARPDGSADFVNKSWVDYVGVPAEQILEWGFLDFYHPDDIPGMVEIWKHDLEHSDSTVLEGRIRGHDGHYRRFLFSGRKLTDANGIVRWFGCNVDIENLQQAQDALRVREMELTENEQRLKLTIDTMPAAIWSSSPDGKVEFFNRHFLDYVGLPLEDVAEHGFYRMFHPDDLDLMTASWNRIVATGQPEPVDGRIMRYDGEYRWFTLRQSPLLDAKGSVVKWYGIVLEIEDRKRAEEGLRRSETELAHVTRLTTMGELAVSIAHEVSQPLMAIVTNAGTCLRWLEKENFDVDLARQAARRIIEDGHRAGDIITSIRALARKAPVKMQAMDLRQAIRDVLLVLQGELRRCKVIARPPSQTDPLTVRADATQLQQVLLNLIMNAVEAMSQAGSDERRLAIHCTLLGNGFARVDVVDTGPGLDKDHAGQMFDAFFSTKQDGLGMGLSICRSIVEAHGGKIWAENNRLTGSTFSFTVPMLDPSGNNLLPG
jgi:PAS domain S-box-containing protein